MANRYWVGGTASWDATAGTKWALTSGGAGGEAVPTAADDVFIDAASGAVTVTTTTGIACRSLNFTGFTGTFNHAASTTINIGDTTAGAGNVALKMVAGMTYTRGSATTSSMVIKASGASPQTITLAGKSLGAVTFNTSPNLELADAFSANSLSMTSGTFSTNNFSVTLTSTSTTSCLTISGSTAKTINLGSSTVTLSGSWLDTATNTTFNAGTSTIAFAPGASSVVFDGNGRTFYNVTYSPVSSNQLQIQGANTFNNLTFTGGASKVHGATFDSNQTVNGTLTFTGNSVSNRLIVDSDFGGTQRTITAATTSITYTDFTDIIGAGTAAWTGTSVGGFNTSGITIATPVTRYWVGNGGNWSDTAHWSATSGGASGATVPLPQDTAIINASSISSASQTITIDTPRACSNVNFTGVLNTPALALTGYNFCRFYNNLTFVSGMTITNDTQDFYLRANTDSTLTTGGLTIPRTFIFEGALNKYSLVGNLTLSSPRGIILSHGEFDANDYNVTCSYVDGDYLDQPSGITLRMGNGVWTLNYTGTVWRLGSTYGPTSRVTLFAENSTIDVTDTSATSKTLDMGSRTYNNITFTGDNIILQDSNTFNTFALNTAGRATGLKVTSGTTQTVSNFTSNGSAGSLAKIASTTAASPFTLAKVGGIVSESYMSIQDSTVTGGGWYASTTSTNVSGNTNWSFMDPPADITKTAQYKVYNTPTLISLNDSFDDNSIDGAKWGVISPGSGRYAETGGRLEITSHTVSGTYDGIYSLNSYNFSNKTAYVELVNAGNQSIAGLQAVLKLYIDSNNSVALWVGGGSIHAQQQVSGTYTDLFSVAYNSTNHRWLRIVEYDGVTYWQVSPDCVTWTELYHKANPITMTALYPEISAGVYQTETLTTTTIWNNFNIITVDYDITKTAAYVVLTNTDVPKTAQYTVTTDNTISKSAAYSTVLPSPDITKTAEYVIAPFEILNSSNLKALKIGKAYGPITSVILGRVPQNDNVVIASRQPQANVITSIDTGTNLFTITGHNMEDGNLIRIQSTGTLPAPLQPNTNYYAWTNGSADTFALTDRYEDSILGTNPINITTSGSGTIQLSHIETQEVQINNNQIMDDDRQDLLLPIYTELVGLEWNEVKADTVGLGWHEVGDVVIFEQGATSVYGFLDEIHLTFDGSIRENLVSTIPDVATINYQTAGGILKTIYNTEIKVDKQENDITSIVSQQDVYATEVQENFTQIYQDIDNIDLTIQKSGGGNLIRNSVGFATEPAQDNSSVRYDKFSFWDYNVAYDTATDGTAISYSSSESQNAGGTSGQVIKMVGSDILIKQRINVAVNTELSFGVRVKNAVGAGDATFTLSNDNDTFTITVDDSNPYVWQELLLQDFVSSQSFLDLTIQVSSATGFEFTDMRLLYGTTIQGWVQSPSEILSANVQFTTLGMRIFDNVHDTTTQVTYNEFSTRRKSDDFVLFEADDSGVVANDVTIKGVTNYNSDTDTVIKQVTIPESSTLAGIAFIKVS